MTDSAFVLPRAIRTAIARHVRRDLPRECCGFLVGTGRVVAAAVPMRNVAASPTRYRIDPQAHIELRRTMRNELPRREIIGVYHSHPSGRPEPSETDIAEANYPHWLHVIAARTGDRVQLRGFTITGRRAVPVRLAFMP